MNFGAHRVGDVINTQTFSVSNTAAISAYSEKLQASYGVVGLPFNFSKAGSTDTVVAGNNATDTVSMSSQIAGNYTGVNQGAINVGFTSLAGASDLTNTTLSSQAISLTGQVYAEAVAALQTPALNFGIVHINDVVEAQSISVKNSTSGALTDVLNASISNTPLVLPLPPRQSADWLRVQ